MTTTTMAVSPMQTTAEAPSRKTAVWLLASVFIGRPALMAIYRAFAYLLPLDLAPAVLNASWPVIVVPTGLFHLYWTKKADLRA
jgi:hypothetical protein